MADWKLAPASPLGGYQRDFGAVDLAERFGVGIVSVTVAEDARADFAARVRNDLQVDPPPVGASVVVAASGMRLLGLQPDQYFALFDHHGDSADRVIAERFGGAGVYTTDQSDGWALLAMDGPGSRDALALLSMLDLHEDAFPLHGVARTVMEHLAVIVVREGPDAFLLLTPRSSARSLLHAVETACS